MLKKILAFALAGAMVIGTMSFNAFADATGGAQSVDDKISITGLSDGDSVELYKVLEWTSDWGFTSDFSTIPDSAAVLGRIKDHTWTADDVAEITKLAGGTAKYSGTASGGKFEQSNPEAGMYIAIVKPKDAGVVYNPIIISADYESDNTSNTIDASNTNILETAVAKRKDVTVEKTEPKITNDDGGTYNFTVATTIPVYSSAFSNTFFNVSDTVSEHLDFDPDTLVVKVDGTVIYDKDHTTLPTGVTVDTGSPDATFTVAFAHDYMKTLTAAASLEITYDAKLNVPLADLTSVTEEDNEVTVTFPNSPSDLTGKDVTALKDGTKEYTFSIDGSLFGNKDYQTGEIVKIGVDSEGNVLESLIPLSNGTEHGALANAVFGLYKEQADADAGNENYYTNSVFNGTVTTDSKGLMKIDGLDAGTYYLKELTAPAGYIKDTATHTIIIEADIDGDDDGETGKKVTEYYTVDDSGNVTWHKEKVPNSTPYDYYVPVLKTVTITVDGAKSKYTMTLSGPSISSVTPGDSTTEIKNTKGVELPSTGGIGTTLFYAGGAVLVLLAGVLLVSKRRIA